MDDNRRYDKPGHRVEHTLEFRIFRIFCMLSGSHLQQGG
jgi:hypothetical protein